MTRHKVIAAVVGAGHTGSHVLSKLLGSRVLEVRYMLGADDLTGLALAHQSQVIVSTRGPRWLLAQQPRPDIVFDTTSPAEHTAHAPLYANARVQAIDLTGAHVGSVVCPPINLPGHLDSPNISMLTGAGQGAAPVVHAVSRVTHVPYAEVVTTIDYRSVDPARAANLETDSQITARALEVVGGARQGHAVTVPSFLDPFIAMKMIIFCEIEPSAPRCVIKSSVRDMVAQVRKYAPGYTLGAAPWFHEPRPGSGGNTRVGVLIEVIGSEHHSLHNLGDAELLASAAICTGDRVARRILLARDRGLSM